MERDLLESRRYLLASDAFVANEQWNVRAIHGAEGKSVASNELPTLGDHP